ncbi:MAG: RNA polymerase factor sigma-54 [bacterium]
MAIRFEQVQRQTQKLILSPQMQQAIKLLLLPLPLLQQTIRQEMAQNPVLEEELSQEEAQEEGQEPEAQHEAEGEEDSRRDEAGELNFEEEFNRLLKIDDEWKEYFRQSGSYRKYSEEDEEKRRFLESSVVKPETLQENLLSQLGLALLDDGQKRICEAIVGNIDDNGYLRGTIEDIAQQLGVAADEVVRMLALIQTLSPVGVGARDLRECLLIQLRRLAKQHTIEYRIVERHLDELGGRKYRQIAKALGVSPVRVQKAAELIETLDPKPGRIFSAEQAQYITPDVFVEKDASDYNVILNDDRIPHLRISNLYRQMTLNPDADRDTKTYIREKIKGGQWLLRNIKQRQQTIYNIASEIVKKQQEFFDEGITHLTPLTLQQVADSLNIHESTVSRAIANKYIQTPHGLFDMKYFFTAGIASEGGGSIAIPNVKSMIQQMIGREDPRSPLSDQQVIDMLKVKGITLARRTVTKYRKELGILSSNQRRKY